MNEASGSVTETAKGLGGLLAQGAQLGIDLVGSMVRDAARRVSPAGHSIGCRGPSPCGCEIPPPCWEPQRLGELTSFVCPGDTATVRFRITNCGAQPRRFGLDAPAEAEVKFTPAALALGPMERGVAGASLTMPADAEEGQRREVVLWVRGCNVHFLRWTVSVSSKGSHACHEVCVEDCPDYLHHWYDHFYCRHHCRAGAR